MADLTLACNLEAQQVRGLDHIRWLYRRIACLNSLLPLRSRDGAVVGARNWSPSEASH